MLRFSRLNLNVYTESSFLISTHVFLGIDTVGNGEDVNYIWRNSNTPNEIMSTSDKVTQHRILRLWTNFVKHL